MKKRNKGISLIVLVLTIIVTIILASTVIITLNQNNSINEAREVKFKENVKNLQYEFAMTKSNRSDQNYDSKYITATTVEEIKKYIPSFKKEYEGKLVIKNDELIYVEEKVNEIEKEWFMDLGIRTKTAVEKVNEDPQLYYGSKVTNYESNGITDWKIFYADENNVYLITSEYVPVSKLPKTLRDNKPENIDENYPKSASFTNVISDYQGSANITDEKVKALSSDYFSKGYTSENSNMKAVAYMLDTQIWSSFAGEKAEYAIGGPTLEMLMNSYNTKYNKSYLTRAQNERGYEFSDDGGITWKVHGSGMIDNGDRLYVLPQESGADGMWVACTVADNTSGVFMVQWTGLLYRYNFDRYNIGFRAIVCLKSDVLFKTVEDGYEIQ